MNIVNDTPELRAELDAHNANAIRLHLPTAPVTWIDMKLEAPDGKVVHEHREKANSWVRNLYNTLACTLLPTLSLVSTYGAGYLALKDTSGAIRVSSSTAAIIFNGTVSNIVGANGNITDGVIVGTGAGAESFESFYLESVIEHGNGAGQLAYSAGVLETASYNSETKKWTQTISRIMNNNTAGEIVVSEVGLCRDVFANGSYRRLLVDRSLLASPVAVPAAYKLTVTYTTEITFPA